MKLKLVTVGKTKLRHWQTAEADFVQRIERYAQVQQVVVKDASRQAFRNGKLVKETEAKALAQRLYPDDFVVALHPTGMQMSSEAFARFFREKTLHGRSRFAFVIGGPLGLDRKILNHADFVLSLSDMTFPHELAKVILLEQIYRAMTILKGEKSHRGC